MKSVQCTIQTPQLSMQLSAGCKQHGLITGVRRNSEWGVGGVSSLLRDGSEAVPLPRNLLYFLFQNCTFWCILTHFKATIIRSFPVDFFTDYIQREEEEKESRPTGCMISA